MPPVKQLSILGSTGSIGVNALQVVEHLNASGGARVRVRALAARGNAQRLLAQARRHKPQLLALSDPAAADWLKRRLKGWRGAPRLVAGPDALTAAATLPGVNLVLTSVVGAAGLVPTLAAIRAGKHIALANKETLVAAGELVRREAARHKVRLLPVDSEHNAIFQCLAGLPRESEVKRLILTASGGPFRLKPAAELMRVTAREALKHPTWKMGPKISVDSATLMNKGLEVIEARWLFGLDFHRITVVVHPQSVIHSMVETVDGSVLAQLGPPDMRLPIQFAFTWPRRVDHGLKPLDFLALAPLTFQAPDLKRFPCLGLAYLAGSQGGTAPAVLNAANEAAVEAFLAGRLSFPGIPRMIRLALAANPSSELKAPGLDQILAADAWARTFVKERLHGPE
jgi:1-deoxy-D-xylulose-5-phosphate reductoisomerase